MAVVDRTRNKPNLMEYKVPNNYVYFAKSSAGSTAQWYHCGDGSKVKVI